MMPSRRVRPSHHGRRGGRRGLGAAVRRGRGPVTALARRFGASIAFVLAGALGGLGYALFAPSTYTATAFVLVVDDTTPRRGASAAVDFAQTYGRLAPLPETLRYSRIPLPEADPSTTREHLQTSTSPDTPIIRLTGRAGTPRDAAAFANAAADALVRYGRAHHADTRVRVAPMSFASPPSAPSSPNLPLGVAVGTASGVLLAGLGAALLSGRRRPGDWPHDALRICAADSVRGRASPGRMRVGS